MTQQDAHVRLWYDDAHRYNPSCPPIRWPWSLATGCHWCVSPSKVGTVDDCEKWQDDPPWMDGDAPPADRDGADDRSDHPRRAKNRFFEKHYQRPVPAGYPREWATCTSSI